MNTSTSVQVQLQQQQMHTKTMCKWKQISKQQKQNKKVCVCVWNFQELKKPTTCKQTCPWLILVQCPSIETFIFNMLLILHTVDSTECYRDVNLILCHTVNVDPNHPRHSILFNECIPEDGPKPSKTDPNHPRHSQIYMVTKKCLGGPAAAFGTVSQPHCYQHWKTHPRQTPTPLPQNFPTLLSCRSTWRCIVTNSWASDCQVTTYSRIQVR